MEAEQSRPARAAQPPEAACHYAIRVQGRLDRERWAQWFEGMTISARPGETIISGPVADQAALYGMLARLRDLALPLLALERDAGGARRRLAARHRICLAVLLGLLLGGDSAIIYAYALLVGLAHTALALALALLCMAAGVLAGLLLGAAIVP